MLPLSTPPDLVLFRAAPGVTAAGGGGHYSVINDPLYHHPGRSIGKQALVWSVIRQGGRQVKVSDKSVPVNWPIKDPVNVLSDEIIP